MLHKTCRSFTTLHKYTSCGSGCSATSDVVVAPPSLSPNNRVCSSALRVLAPLALTQVLEAELRELLLALPLLSELQVPGCAVSAEFAGEWRALPTGVGRKEDAAATSACRFTHCRR